MKKGLLAEIFGSGNKNADLGKRNSAQPPVKKAEKIKKKKEYKEFTDEELDFLDSDIFDEM